MVESAPFFIVGCPRSGTSLLRDLLRSHRRISIPGESHFIPG
ncbi:MAG: sulfotransferase, partial [Acidobacteria bacterium]|nr:sulfotransferase [Acidobacteriota bacterium]